MTIIGSIGLIYGCAGIPADKNLGLYVKQFEHEVGVKARGVSLYYKELPEHVAGRCILGVRIIQIDKDYFSTLSYLEQKALVYHEIVHCVCSEFDHDPYRSGCGESIMEPSMKSWSCYKRYWNKYIKDLRNKCK